MTPVPTKRFLMGCLSRTEDCLINELPAQEVTIAQPFAIADCEVTLKDCSQFTNREPGKPNPYQAVSQECACLMRRARMPP